MKRRKFIKLLGCASLLSTQVMLGNVEVARSDSAVDRLSLPESDRVQRVKAIGCRGVRTRRPTITSRNICRRVRRANVSSAWC